MGSKDIQLTKDIGDILIGDFAGQSLINYFDNLPEKSHRRAIHLLASMYPGKVKVSDEEFKVILHLISVEKYVSQQSFYEFISCIAVIEFTDFQKQKLLQGLKIHFEILCERCTFELDTLMLKLLGPCALIEYMQEMAEGGNRAVLEHFSDILRSEIGFEGSPMREIVGRLQQEITQRLKQTKSASR